MQTLFLQLTRLTPTRLVLVAACGLLAMSSWQPVLAQSFTQVAVGKFHYCAIDDAGETLCVTRSHAERLEKPDDLPLLKAITAGDNHTCGITLDGKAVCWGGEQVGAFFNGNDFGQLDVPQINQPLRSIVAGTNHTCALDTADKVWCWGLNSNGQADPPDDGNGFQSVAAGRDGSCGLKLDGSVVCWPASYLEYSNNPPMGSYSQIDIAANRVCAITTNGDIECWLGFGDTPANGPYIDLAVAWGAVCGLRQNGLLDCEYNSTTGENNPVNFPAETVFTSIESGVMESVRNHPACGITENGQVACWGSVTLPDEDDIPDQIDPKKLRVSLAILIYSDRRVELFWNNLESTVRAPLYEIYRDGELVETTANGFSWLDDGLEPGASYEYRIRAITRDGQVGEFSNQVGVDLSNQTTSPAQGEAEYTAHPTKPTNIRFFGFLRNAGFVTWDHLDNVPENFLGYQIRRDNEAVGFTTANIFLDQNRPSGTCYLYSVVALSVDREILDFTSRVHNRFSREGCGF